VKNHWNSSLKRRSQGGLVSDVPAAGRKRPRASAGGSGASSAKATKRRGSAGGRRVVQTPGPDSGSSPSDALDDVTNSPCTLERRKRGSKVGGAPTTGTQPKPKPKPKQPVSLADHDEADADSVDPDEAVDMEQQSLRKADKAASFIEAHSQFDHFFGGDAGARGSSGAGLPAYYPSFSPALSSGSGRRGSLLECPSPSRLSQQLTGQPLISPMPRNFSMGRDSFSPRMSPAPTPVRLRALSGAGGLSLSATAAAAPMSASRRASLDQEVMPPPATPWSTGRVSLGGGGGVTPAHAAPPPRTGSGSGGGGGGGEAAGAAGVGGARAMQQLVGFSPSNFLSSPLDAASAASSGPASLGAGVVLAPQLAAAAAAARRRDSSDGGSLVAPSPGGATMGMVGDAPPPPSQPSSPLESPGSLLAKPLPSEIGGRASLADVEKWVAQSQQKTLQSAQLSGGEEQPEAAAAPATAAAVLSS
jgi:hypothetical protein